MPITPFQHSSRLKRKSGEAIVHLAETCRYVRVVENEKVLLLNARDFFLSSIKMSDKVRYDDTRWNCAVSKPFHLRSDIFIGRGEDVSSSMNDDVSDDDGSIRVLVRISISSFPRSFLLDLCSFLYLVSNPSRW